MKTYVVRLDSQKARVFDYPNDKTGHEIVEKHVDHHTHGKHESNQNRDHLFKMVTDFVKTGDEVLVLGQHVINAEFKHYVEKHEASLSKKIVGVENLDSHATDPEAVAKANDFFKHFRTFQVNS